MRKHAWLALLLSLPFAIACGDDDGTTTGTDPDMDIPVDGTDTDMVVDDDMGDDMGDGVACGGGLTEPPCFLEQIKAEPETGTLGAVIDAILACVDGAATNLAGLDLLAPTRTIFAPTDDAVGAAATALGVDFAAISTALEADPACGEGTLTAEQIGGLNTLFGIIAYHIIDGQFAAADLASNTDGFVRTVIGQLEGGQGVKAYLNEAGDGIRYVGLDGAPTEAGVDRADIAVTIGRGDANTTIHVIDAVLVPPTITGVAILEGLTGLVGALGAADPLPGDPPTPLTLALSDPSASYTVFAPDNAAFDMLAEVPPSDVLQGILLFHVNNNTDSAVNGGNAFLSTQLPDSVMTLSGGTLTIDDSGDPVTINGGSATDGGADVIAVDIQASNGVVHLINRVLLPPVPAG
ncbi:MAG: fasciclin domain-containing protein [Myxococcota bacterium]